MSTNDQVKTKAKADLARSGLTMADAKKLKLGFLTEQKTKVLTGCHSKPAYSFPYPQLDGKLNGYARLRFLTKDKNFAGTKAQRYWQPKDSAPKAYLPIYHDWLQIAADPNMRLDITEGEKKAAKACKEGFSVLGLAGIWNFKSKKQGVGLIDVMQNDIVWPKRDVIWLPDSDVKDHAHNMQGIVELANILTAMGARVYFLPMPDICEEKTGLDDFLVKEGPDALKLLIKKEAQLLSPSKQIVYLNFKNTDAGNGEAMALLHGNDLRYLPARGWLKWAGHYWAKAADSVAYQAAKQTVRTRQEVASQIQEDDKRKHALKWAIDSENKHRLDATANLAKMEPPIVDDLANWDADPFLLAVNNGVIDLKTGKLMQGNPTQRISKHVDIEYDPQAKCPRFDKFLKEVFSDKSLIDFIQRAVGYSLSGDTSEECLFLCHGTGANGKSKFLEIVGHIAGEYAANTPFSTFANMSSNDSSSNDIAALQGKRLVTASEIKEGTALNEGRVKSMTGRDTVSARFLFKEYFEFRPVAKFWLAFNHKPRVKDNSPGFWRRIRLIPFSNSFIGKEDRRLDEKLKAEAAGILNWAIAGCLLWQKSGLQPPKIIEQATQDYRCEEDTLAEFILERCEEAPLTKTRASDLYEAYTSWAENRKDRYRLGSRTFYEQLESRFKKVKPKNVSHYVGIALNPHKFAVKRGEK